MVAKCKEKKNKFWLATRENGMFVLLMLKNRDGNTLLCPMRWSECAQNEITSVYMWVSVLRQPSHHITTLYFWTFIRYRLCNDTIYSSFCSLKVVNHKTKLFLSFFPSLSPSLVIVKVSFFPFLKHFILSIFIIKLRIDLHHVYLIGVWLWLGSIRVTSVLLHIRHA